MDRLSMVTLAASKAYTDSSIAGGGAIKGKNCQIKSSTPITGGTRIVFAWYLDNGTEQTTTMDVMDGEKGETGLGIKSAAIVNSHLILTMDDDTTIDAGLVSGFDTDMSHITDIDLSNLGDGQILKYNGTTRKWENASAGTVDTNLVDLNDVDVENLEDGQIIVWDATAGRWKNADNAPSITIDNTPTQGSTNAVSSGGAYSALDNKVDKVSGKGLSANDYTNADKAIVDGVTAALAEKADVSDVPTKTSDLTNDSGFIVNTVNNLVNYYLKSETYTKSEVDAIVGAISTLHFEAVSVLPSENIQTNVIYLVPKSTAQTDNVKDEYINLDGTSYGWELIGSTEIDLSNYVTTTALNTALADYVTSTGLATILADYATTSAMNTALADKVDKVSGKGLSENDYTTTEKNKLAGLVNYDDTSISNRVSAIEEVVPSDATTSNKLATQSDIPSLTDYVQKSQTAGLIKNDGTIDSTSYATSASANKSVKTEYTLSYNSWEAGTGDYLGYYIYEIETNPRLNGDYPVNVYLSSGQASDFMPTAEEVEAFNDSIVGGDMFSSDMGDYTKITLIAWQRPVDRSQTPKNLKVFIEGVKY